jgi:hypothetical protein
MVFTRSSREIMEDNMTMKSRKAIIIIKITIDRSAIIIIRSF